MNSEVVPQAATERLLHGEYWSRGGDGRVTLIARECTACNACYLPGIVTCVNCKGTAFRERRIASPGTLYTYTIVRGSGGVWPDVYAIGYVDFEAEKVRVCGHIKETDAAALRIGMTMNVEEATLYTEAGGTQVKCFRFHAAKGTP